MTRVSDRGFTLIELLISIAVIFMLVGVLLLALRSGKAAADRTTTLNALRQIMTGYGNYSNEHMGRLLPGYIDPANIGNTIPHQQLDIKARLKSGATLTAADTSGYVWRLAPYMNHGYSAFLADYSKGLQKRYHNEFDQGVYGPGSLGSDATPTLGIGFTPSIGYNSIHLGGDNVHGGNSTYSPWGAPNPNEPPGTGSVAVWRVSDIRYPTKTIAFASCKAVNMTLPEVGEQLGYVELRPPWIVSDATPSGAIECNCPQWVLDDQNQLQPWPGNFTGPGGLMVDRAGGRSGDKVPTAHADGSVILFNPMTNFVDPTLTGEQFKLAYYKVIAQWSPRWADWLGTAP